MQPEISSLFAVRSLVSFVGVGCPLVPCVPSAGHCLSGVSRHTVNREPRTVNPFHSAPELAVASVKEDSLLTRPAR